MRQIAGGPIMKYHLWMDLPPLHLLRTFEVSAREASFSAASRELGMSQSAISQQVGQLEAWLGRKLFLREGRGVRLSPAGAELQDAVAAGLGLIGRAAGRLRRDQSSTDLNVACVPWVAIHWLIPHLSAFKLLYPAINVRLLHADVLQAFDRGKMDVLISMSRTGPEGALRVPLFSRGRRPLASALLARTVPELRSLSGLSAADLLHDEDGYAWAAWFAKAGWSDEAAPQGRVFQDMGQLSSALLAGQGVALAPVGLFSQQIARGELVVLSDVEIEDDRIYTMTHDPDVSPATAIFAEWFARLCRMES